MHVNQGNIVKGNMVKDLKSLSLPGRLIEKLMQSGFKDRQSLQEALDHGKLRDIPGIGEQTENTIRRALSPGGGAEKSGGIEPRFFSVGLIILIVALAMAVWAFSAENLTGDRRQILRWVFSLASGFSAGAFAGSLTVKTCSRLTGFLATATGGFAVWFITHFTIFPVLSGAVSPPLPPPDPSVQIEESGLDRLTDSDRESEWYGASSVCIDNHSDLAIRIAYSFPPRMSSNTSASVSKYVHIITEEILPHEGLEDERQNFGGPMHLSVLADGQWHPTNTWYNFGVVPTRLLSVDHVSTGFVCQLTLGGEK